VIGSSTRRMVKVASRLRWAVERLGVGQQNTAMVLWRVTPSEVAGGGGSLRWPVLGACGLFVLSSVFSPPGRLQTFSCLIGTERWAVARRRDLVQGWKGPKQVPLTCNPSELRLVEITLGWIGH
jgi:hypothetical protein